MKQFDVFDKRGDYLGTEFYPDDFPTELVQTDVRTKSTYPPSVWVLPAELADAGVAKARIEWAPSGLEDVSCCFCGKGKSQVPAMVASAVDPSKAICSCCVNLLRRH